MASVASSATSSAPAGGGPLRTEARSPPRMRCSRASAARAHRAAAAVHAAQGAAGDEVEGDELGRGVGVAADDALIEDRTGAFEDERLEEEARREERGVVGGVGEGAEGAGQHRVEGGVGVALLRESGR